MLILMDFRGSGRRAATLVEVLVATVILAGLSLSIYDVLIASARGIQVDRVAEAKRHLVLDLLEQFCHPYTDLPLLYPKGTPSPATRQISVDEAMTLVGMPADERPVLKAILDSGGVVGFTLLWHRGLTAGTGSHSFVRKDRLWVYPVTTRQVPGPRVDCFRVFHVRG